MLLQQTRLFRDTMYKSNLPWTVRLDPETTSCLSILFFFGPFCPLADSLFSFCANVQLVQSAAGTVCIPRSPSCMWLGDGSFYNFEGCNSDSGCCPLNCTHVLDYSVALSRVWPDLEQSQRTNDLDLQISPNGIIPSRSTVPIWLRRQWTFWPNYTDRDPDQTICSDGEICTGEGA